MSRLYAWVDPSPALAPDVAAKLAHKAPYLNVPFWTIRAALVLAVWSVAGERLIRWASRLGADEPRYRTRLVTLATPGLPAVAILLMFAVFDWLMSLTPLRYSTIFALLFWSGGFLAALALVAGIGTNRIAGTGSAPTIASKNRRYPIGSRAPVACEIISITRLPIAIYREACARARAHDRAQRTACAGCGSSALAGSQRRARPDEVRVPRILGVHGVLAGPDLGDDAHPACTRSMSQAACASSRGWLASRGAATSPPTPTYRSSSAPCTGTSSISCGSFCGRCSTW